MSKINGIGISFSQFGRVNSDMPIQRPRADLDVFLDTVFPTSGPWHPGHA
jgi:hypothetical protein